MPAIFSCVTGGAGPWPTAPAKAAPPKPPALPRAADVGRLDGLLAALGAFGDGLAAAAALLAAAPAPVVRELEAAFPEGDVLPGFSAGVEACAARLQADGRRAERLLRVVGEARQRGDAARAALAARDDSWGSKKACDARAEVLDRRFGPTFTLEEKRERLKARHRANEEFRERSEEAARVLDGYLAEQWTLAAGLMGEVCQCYAAVFAGADGLGTTFRELSSAALASRPPPASGLPRLEPPADMEALPLPPQPSSAATAEDGVPAADSASPSWLAGPLWASLLAAGVAAATGAAPVPIDEDRQRRATSGAMVLRAGDAVEVWSVSSQRWFVGVVVRVYDVDGSTEEGLRVHAGVVKVSFAAGVKYIRPEHIAEQLRPPSTAARSG